MPRFSTRPEIAGTFGMVTSTHWLASQSGMAVLESGGNAFDAAVAAGLVLQVVEPHLNGPGGEVPVVAWSAAEQRPFVVCGQGGAPAAATIGAFGELGLDLVPGTGLLPACVPGAFGAWMLLLERWGTLPLRDVMRYAIGYAEVGHPVLPRVAATVELLADHFRAHWPTSAAQWLPGGRPPRAGELVPNKALARTYRRVLEEAEQRSTGRDGQIEAARSIFYEGFVAEAIDRFCRGEPVLDISGERHRGLLGGEDLARWRAGVEQPVTAGYRGLTVCKPGPWTQGPVLLQQLLLLEHFELDGWDPVSAELIHTTTECAKLAFADREAYYGDPAFVDVPLEDLLSPGYARARAALVTGTASRELRPGTPGGRSPLLPRCPDAAGYPADSAQGIVTNGRLPELSPDGRMRGDTCHLDVADRFGNVVSATPSGGWLQSSPTVEGLGFALGTRGEMFWLQEGLPNSLAPGKRPRTTLTPSLVLGGDGLPSLAFGTPGGDQQDQWTLLFFLRHVHHEPDLQLALDAPVWHTSHFPSSFYPRTAHPGRVHVERAVGDDVLAALRARGHDVVEEAEWSLGRTTALRRDPDGVLHAAANARGMQAYAVGR